MIAGGTVATGVVLYRRAGALRAAADRVDLRWPILAHVIRFPIGAYLLHQMRAGVVPELFAMRAGPGDMAAGALALVAAALLPARSPSRRRVIAAWCVLGMLDLAVAFGTAQYLLFVVGDPRMALIGELRWALLPVLIVPFMILTHLLVLARLRAAR